MPLALDLDIPDLRPVVYGIHVSLVFPRHIQLSYILTIIVPFLRQQNRIWSNSKPKSYIGFQMTSHRYIAYTHLHHLHTCHLHTHITTLHHRAHWKNKCLQQIPEHGAMQPSSPCHQSLLRAVQDTCNKTQPKSAPWTVADALPPSGHLHLLLEMVDPARDHWEVMYSEYGGCPPWHAPQRSDDTTTESSPHFAHHSHPLPEMLGGDGQAKSQMGQEWR
jgi:hypothetical protein